MPETDQKFPDLTFRTNQWWAIKMAALWSLLLIPNTIAHLKQQEGMEIVLGILGMVACLIVFFKSLRSLTEGKSLADLEKRGMKFPWTLLLGIVAWQFFLRLPIAAGLIDILGVPQP